MQYQGWNIELALTREGDLRVTVEAPNPGMSTDPVLPFVDVVVDPGLRVSGARYPNPLPRQTLDLSDRLVEITKRVTG